MAQDSPKRIVVGITGASGALYAARAVQLLVAEGVQTHLVVSPLGQRLLRDELGMHGIDLQALAGATPQAAGANPPAPPVPPAPASNTTPDPTTPPSPGELIHHHFKDVGATIASGSFRHDGMLIIPCSSNTLGAIASGSAQTLIHRAAHVTLKERRPLVLAHRESPLSLIDIDNMRRVTEAGAIVAPANPGFYMLPQSIEEVADFVVGRCLDLLKVPHDLNIRWAMHR